MIDEEEILERIVSFYPKKKEQISSLYKENKNFCEICEVFLTCYDSLNEIKSKKNIKLKKEIMDLEIALRELNRELLSRL